MFQILKRNKNFRNFFLAVSISVVGDYVDDIAIAQLIYAVTNSTLLMSYVFAIKILLTFLSMFTAAYVDKHSKKKILLVTSFGQGIILLVLLFLYTGNCLNTGILIAFVTVQTIFSTFSIPTRNAMLPYLVSDDEVVNARGLMNMFTQMIQVFSYMGSGIIIGMIGIKGAIGLDSITFFASMIFLYGITMNDVTERGFSSPQSFFSNVKTGFAFVTGNKIICGVLLVTFLGNMFTAPVDSLMPAYFSQGGYGASSYSVFMIGIALGSIFGSILLNRMRQYFSNNILFSTGFLIGGIGILLLYLNTGFLPFAAAFIIGISYGFISVLNATIIQVNTPKEMIARTFSIFKCISYVSGPLGIVLAGFAGEFFAMNIILAPLGVLLVLTCFLSMWVLKR
ncbi:MAG: MFS transporter [Eubacteriales bacterium]|nr:MFS transporter [Eubacteriales bacterium]